MTQELIGIRGDLLSSGITYCWRFTRILKTETVLNGICNLAPPRPSPPEKKKKNNLLGIERSSLVPEHSFDWPWLWCQPKKGSSIYSLNKKVLKNAEIHCKPPWSNNNFRYQHTHHSNKLFKVKEVFCCEWTLSINFLIHRCGLNNRTVQQWRWRQRRRLEKKSGSPPPPARLTNVSAYFV